jgi:hypothetical protein
MPQGGNRMASHEDLELLHEMFGEEEDLDPELEPYLETNELGWTMLRHPLVYSMFHHDRLNALVNKQLHAKLEELDKAIAERNYTKFVYLHERPYRIDAFGKLLEFCDVNDHEKNLAVILLTVQLSPIAVPRSL